MTLKQDHLCELELLVRLGEERPPVYVLRIFL